MLGARARVGAPARALRARGRAGRARAATSSPAATASTASAGTASPTASSASSRVSTRSAGSASSLQAPPSSEELIYAWHDRGFSLHSMRSPEVTRLYLQCAPDENIDEWPDERIWEELHARLGLDGWTLQRGPDPREGRHRHAELRRRADAARPALPRRRRRPHRSADRGEGAEPRRRRRSRSSARRSQRGTATATTSRARELLARRACGGSGVPSTSRGG